MALSWNGSSLYQNCCGWGCLDLFLCFVIEDGVCVRLLVLCVVGVVVAGG